MSVRVAALRALAAFAALVVLVAAIDWLRDVRLPQPPAERLFPLVMMQVKQAFEGTTPRALVFALWCVALANAVLAAGLALRLAFAGRPGGATRPLVVALACGAVATAYFWFLRDLPGSPLGALAGHVLLDIVATALLVFSLAALVACFREYPQPLSVEVVEHGIEEHVRAQSSLGSRIRAGEGPWRLWRWLPPELYGAYGRALRPELAGIARALRSRELVWVVLALACVVVAATSGVFDKVALPMRVVVFLACGYLAILFLDPVANVRWEETSWFSLHRRVNRAGIARGEVRLHRFLASPPGLATLALFAVAVVWVWTSGPGGGLAGLALMLFALCAVGHAVSLLSFNWRHGLPGHRRAIEWIFLGTGGAFTLWWMAILVVGAIAFATGVDSRGPQPPWLTGTLVAGPPLVAFALVASLWASILHRGTFDPALALRRGTATAAVGVALTILFVAIEGAVSSQMVVRFGWPSESGAIAAGAATALCFGPVRKRVDRAVDAALRRLLPHDALADGERRELVMLFADLSGYTRLSETDEREALKVAAALHRRAHQVAPAHGGRVVKTIGDAVLCVFDDPARAIDAVHALHAGYAADVAAHDLEPLPVHSGLHRGDVVVARDGDVFGVAVNLAARLQALAGPDEIVVSAALADALRARRADAEMLPQRRFKNVAEPVDCLRVRVGN